MSESTRNQCCNLPDGQHKCQDLNCKRNPFPSLDALEKHMRDKGHFDSAHNPGGSLGSRSARHGVALAVGAEKGAATLDDDVGLLDDLARADRNAATLAEKFKHKAPENENASAKPAPKRKRGAAADADDDVDDKVDVQASESESEQLPIENVKVDELIAEHKKLQHKRRSKDAQPRATSSMWIKHGAVAVAPEGDRNRKAMVSCVVCGSNVVLNENGSSSNLKKHYESRHNKLYDLVAKAIADRANNDDVRALFHNEKQKVSATKLKSGDIRSSFVQVQPGGAAVASSTESKRMEQKKVNRVSQILYAAATDTPLTVIGSSLHAAYIASLGGSVVDESKTGLLDMLPKVHAAVEDLTCQASANAKVGSIAVDGWSSALSAPVMGMTVMIVDASWQLRTIPLGLLNLQDMEKTANNQAAVMAAMLRSSKRLGDRFVVHTGISDNEAAVARAVEIVTNNSGALRCLVHTLSLVMKTDVLVKREHMSGSSYIVAIIERAHAVATFANQHDKFEAQLRDDQVKVDKVSADRVRTLKTDMPTRWYSQLTVLESYVGLHQNLERVCDRLHGMGEPVPLLLTADHMRVAAEAITVMREVRRVGRALEADKAVTASRAPRILWELYETLSYWCNPNQQPTAPRASVASDDKAVLTARSVLLQSPHVRKFAGDITEALKERLGSVWQKADAVVGKEIDDRVSDFETLRRALLFHLAAMMDVNECALEWLPHVERAAYYEALYTAMALNKAQLDFSADGRAHSADEVLVAKALFKVAHNSMLAQLNKANRQNVDAPLAWWRAVEANPLQNIDAAHFVTSARAFLAMPASSASAERLFSDAGNVEGAMRHNQSTATLDMNLVVRGWVRAELHAHDGDASSLANTTEMFAKLVKSVCNKVMERGD